MKLTSENVEQVFMDCLYQAGEDTAAHIKAEGIMSTVGFHPDRLSGYKEDVQIMLQCLPEEFYKGWSFLNACNDKDDYQWTDLHQRMEQLFQLGIGLGLAKWQMPRTMWSILLGDMPYVIVSQKLKGMNPDDKNNIQNSL